MMHMKRAAVLLPFITLYMTQAVCAETGPASFAYILQADSFAQSKASAVRQLAACGRDWIVLDTAFAGGMPWERAEIETVRGGRPERKVIAYISIGEAEDYRPYWRSEWSLKTAAPAWLGTENPEWKGNYRVKYWQAEWQNLILAAVDDAMSRGFDGVYLDIVDGFQTFEQDGQQYIDDRINPETRQSFRRDMVDWVKAIAVCARAKNPDALIIPQNGSQLLEHADFLSAISAIGIEDLFTNGDRLQPKPHTKEVLGHLEKMDAAQKPVLLIEYPKSPVRQSLSQQLAEENGMIWLITDRPLKTLGTSGKTTR